MPSDPLASKAWPPLFGAWVVALFSSLAALFIGEVMGQAPCVLCWFQRAFMFPLAVVLGVAALRHDVAVRRYALPLAGIGVLIAAFHVAQFFGFIPERMVPCSEGPSCSGHEMTLFGVVPIPLLSLGAFIAIGALLLTVRRPTA